MTLVVDASVAALWVLQQPGSDRAEALSTEPKLIAPSLIAAEIGNALWKAVRRGDATRENAVIALDAALLPLHEIMPSEDLRSRALEIAIELNHPIYDCFYLALAERERCAMVTEQRIKLHQSALRAAAVVTSHHRAGSRFPPGSAYIKFTNSTRRSPWCTTWFRAIAWKERRSTAATAKSSVSSNG